MGAEALTVTEGRRGRVNESHSIARRALRLAGGFAVLAAAWSLVVLFGNGSWWGPLHAFVVGTVLLAISGASQMFTITWATAPPPSRRLTATQRWLVAGGTVGVLVGVTAGTAPVVWLGAAALAGGIGLLAVSLRATIRRSLLRRFDLSARFYLVALAAGAIGVALGAVLGSGTAGEAYPTLRLVHSQLNLMGLIGLTIVGTLPTFLPTIAHRRAVSGREALAAWWLGVAGVVSIAAGVWAPPAVVGAGTLLVAVAGAIMASGIVIRLRGQGRRYLSFHQVVAGMAWLVAGAVVNGVGIVSGSPPLPFTGWTAAVVVAGVGQVVAGSVAYLVPVLLGPGHQQASAILAGRPMLPLLAANLTGAGLLAESAPVAAASLALWLVDLTRRLVEALRTEP